jgi:predicted flavoprotein YhiN
MLSAASAFQNVSRPNPALSAASRSRSVPGMDKRRVIIVGGGAAGFFAAIACAEAAGPAVDVTIYEATAHPLAKVRVSGGGRCNVTNACQEPRELVKNYPRGARELLGPLTRFGPRETVAWFAARDVPLKAEPDGRMFPVTDSSATIVSCLMDTARKAGVRLVTGCAVTKVERAVPAASGPENFVGGMPSPRISPVTSAKRGEGTPPTTAAPAFRVTLATGETLSADRVLLATGGAKGPSLAAALGHAIEPPVPSLFTFHVADRRLAGLAGLSVETAALAAAGTKLRASGPLLVTHHGLSGPAVLRLSAWGARELHAADYRFALLVNWAAPRSPDEIRAALAAERTAHAKRQVATANPFGLPARLWERLVAAARLAPDAQWAGVGNAALGALVAQLAAGEFAVTGKSMNKEEFVTCGGVRLREVDFATMESRVCPGLHFAGEALDIDGVTGGFNFQSAWTTGWHAGRAMAEA